MNNEQEKKWQKLGAFELNNLMLSLAKKSNSNFLNAGKGNPNWINTLARLAFARLVEFGVKESQRTFQYKNLAAYINEDGIFDRLKNFLRIKNSVSDKFINDILDYIDKDLHLDKDDFVSEITNGVIGNNYPTPNRILENTEIVLNRYLESVLYHGVKLADSTQLFATEGGTAAIVYIFNSLVENHLIKHGDKIAVNTPIFAPYLQIPKLDDYNLEEIKLKSFENYDWEMTSKQLDKLYDPDIKALFFVNPTNPSSHALKQKILKKLKDIIHANPNLMIITDDVYGTFVDDFQSIYSILPKNTLLVYSFSKLYGATGWRLGLIGINKNNIFDKLIRKLPESDKKKINKRYSLVDSDPNKFAFIDRITADSRSIGLYHTAGLSTPQQIMEMLFALTHLVYSRNSSDHYINECRYIVKERYAQLYKSLGIKADNSKNNAKYYSLINIYKLAEKKYGKAFRQYFEREFVPMDFLLKLSENDGVVLLDAVGFGSKKGLFRVSEANLTIDAYRKIAEKINNLLKDYYDKYLVFKNM